MRSLQAEKTGGPLTDMDCPNDDFLRLDGCRLGWFRTVVATTLQLSISDTFDLSISDTTIKCVRNMQVRILIVA
jgi:hypothetical protein